MSRKPASSISTGNPYADLGMAHADTRLAKATLAQRITSVMRDQDLTQVQLAEKLGVDRHVVSMIARGQLNELSLDRLIEWVNRLNMNIEIRVSPNSEPTRPAQTVVSYQGDDDALVASRTTIRSVGVRFD